jgi:single-strand DNA-binding protein
MRRLKMSRGVSLTILIGNLGADPETSYGASGVPVTTISLATKESWRDKESGDRKERTEWHRVKLFGKLSEIASEYLKSGHKIYIKGSNRTSKYTDKEGIVRYSTEVIAEDMEILASPRASEAIPDSNSENEQ